MLFSGSNLNSGTLKNLSLYIPFFGKRNIIKIFKSRVIICEIYLLSIQKATFENYLFEAYHF